MFYVMYDQTDVVICDYEGYKSNLKIGMKLYGTAFDEESAQALASKCEYL